MKHKTPVAVAVAGLTALPTLASPVLAQDADAIVELDAIVLEESRRGVQTETANSITVVNAEEIEARQASSMGELLDSIPNVTLINGSQPSGAAVNIRGIGAWAGTYGTDHKVAVVVDGVASGAEEIYRNGSLLVLEPELFKEVKVTRGPGEGFRHNSGAIGGTIEAQTKDATDFLEGDDTFAFRQKFGYESNGDGLLSTSILAFAPDDRFDVLGFYGYREMNDTKDGDGAIRETAPFAAPSYLLKLNYKLDDDSKLTFGFAQTTSPEEDVPYDAFDPDWGDDLVDRNIKDTTSYLAYRYNPADNDMVNLEARLTFKDEIMDITASTVGANLTNTDHQTQTLGLRLENTSLFDTGNVSHELLVGIEAKRRDRTAIVTEGTYEGDNDSSAPGGVDDSIAVYVTDEMNFGALTLTPQLRYEDQTLTSYNNNESVTCYGPTYCVTRPAIPDGTTFKAQAWTGALAGRYQINDQFAVFGTAAYNENLPVLDDIRSSSNANTSEKATTFEAGVSYDGFDVFQSEDSLKAKLTAFSTHIWDNNSYSSSIDSIDLKGLELELNYASPAFYADFAAAMTRGTINGTDDYFNYAPADSVQLTLGKRFMNDQLDVAVETKHAFANDRTTGSGSTGASDAWTTVALSVGYKPDSGTFEGTEMRLGIENLFDTTYRPYLTSPNRNAKGRNIKFSLAKTF